MINNKNRMKKKRGKDLISSSTQTFFTSPSLLLFLFLLPLFPSSSSFIFLLLPLSSPSPSLLPPSNNQNLYIYSLLNSFDPRNSTSRNGYVFKNGLCTPPFPSSSSLLDPLPLPLPLLLVFVLKSFKTFHRYASSNPLV